jgi:predicted DsbA family dithiol-disulfide isomerase
MLSTLAVKHGIFVNTQAAQEFLRGKECDAEVKRAYATAHRLGVTGVPFFVFQDRYAASGAMGVDEFVHVRENWNTGSRENADEAVVRGNH